MVLWQNCTECILFTEKPEIVPFSFGFDKIDQGKVAQLTCLISSGDMPLTITWSLKGDLISSDPTMTTTMIGRQMSMLIIQSVDYQHSGTYTCRAENPAGITTYSTELKVNGIVTEWHWEYFIYRETWYCSFLLWSRDNRSREICTTFLCCEQWGYANYHILEFEGRHYFIWPHYDNHHAWKTSQYSHDTVCGLSAQWYIHLQSTESCRSDNLLCRT